MKRSILITLAIAAALSCTACGSTDSGTTSRRKFASAETTTAAPTEAAASAYEESTTEAASEEVTTTAETTSSEEETTTAAAVETTTAEAAPAGGEAPAEDVIKTEAPSPEDADYAPAPAKHDIAGITYIQGALIANKTYSLPADFAPGLDPTCENQFYKMTNDASKQGLYIYFASGFRSYEYQSQIYNNYVARDGQAVADTYSARPGHSEHQSGLAIDVNSIDDSFALTPEAKWLADHCHEYGFILRYPQGKEDITGYQYESWHVRYVGTDLSYAIRNSGLTMEEYFGIDSKYKD
ncbi:M15 family metallopeptidase [uncultured Ruminococcus sp.]|uniref:M15 family metallopeptidase n=1 Tax=uncultured Ruminococcus sp. TaxID=165186 RepID=UPI0025F3CB4B|nr:M15 family metallopeptidase [uncultured Ruminococcus sp.]